MSLARSMEEARRWGQQRVEWNEDGRPVWVHVCVDKTERITLPLGQEFWQADQANDTVTPSLSCEKCSVHGWWTNGSFWW